jgi:hypothetical protein
MYEITASMTNDEDFELSFVPTGDDDTALDISAWSFEFVITDGDGNQLLSYTDADDEFTIDLDESQVTIVIDNSEFQAWDTGVYGMGCRYTDGTRTKQLFVGKLKIDDGGFP